MLLIHAMVDIVLFSPAVLFGAVLVAGTLLGTRKSTGSNRLLWPAAVVYVVAVAVFVGGFAVPMVRAELAAGDGDEHVQRGDFEQAQEAFWQASQRSPVANADYLDRRARAFMFAGETSLGGRVMAGGGRY